MVSYGRVHFSCPYLYEVHHRGLWEHVDNQFFLIPSYCLCTRMKDPCLTWSDAISTGVTEVADAEQLVWIIVAYHLIHSAWLLQWISSKTRENLYFFNILGKRFYTHWSEFKVKYYNNTLYLFITEKWKHKPPLDNVVDGLSVKVINANQPQAEFKQSQSAVNSGSA